ncbi:uncharacterized protein [Venturia canescens]|uniref:uncharacterized protein n=1 Tax=Venturia canescens TaxID=32260 RepID=UPI001C9BC15D|nr:uncharacterized protein LOC122408502 [Venturia canescens]
MKTSVTDPWSNGTNHPNNANENEFNDDARFEDSFVDENFDNSRLSDSDQYLARLYSRLKHIKGGTSKKDLVNSLSDVKADCIARLVTNGQCFETEEEAFVAANPVIRHIAPHLQALTASELVHLLKADVLQTVTDEQNGREEDSQYEAVERIGESPKDDQFNSGMSLIKPPDGNPHAIEQMTDEKSTNAEL